MVFGGMSEEGPGRSRHSDTCHWAMPVREGHALRGLRIYEERFRNIFSGKIVARVRIDYQ